MAYIEHSRHFYVNSHNRINQNDTHSSFTYKIDIPTDYQYTHVCLLNAQIPKSWYLVASGATFQLQEISSYVTITVPSKSYSATSFARVLTSLLNTNSPHSWVYAVTLPNRAQGDTAKFTYTVTGNSGSQPSFTFNTHLYEQFGFDSGTVATFSASSLTSTNVFRFQADETLYIQSDMCTNGSDSILASIVAIVPDFSTIQYTCPNVRAYSKRLVTQNSSSFYFKITNEDFQLKELNGLNVTFDVLVWRKSKALDAIPELLKYTVTKDEAINAKQDAQSVQQQPQKLPLIELTSRNGQISSNLLDPRT
jgi:hypothetical protein